jgi:hypothetical protein
MQQRHAHESSDASNFLSTGLPFRRLRCVRRTVAGLWCRMWGLPPFQLALEASGDPIDVRLPVSVPAPLPVSARVP